MNQSDWNRTLRYLFLFCLLCSCGSPGPPEDRTEGPGTRIQAIYGGIPEVEPASPNGLRDLGINAIFLHSGGITQERSESLKAQGIKFFAEFNTMHVKSFLEEFPGAAPIGPDGRVSPPPHDWQGICPTHQPYREDRMKDFRRLLVDYELDGIWLDYHHAHSSWERAEPVMPDTCFCDRCLQQFQEATGVTLPDGPTANKSTLLLGGMNEQWVQWRCDVFTDWIREFRFIIDEVRPEALLGTFHNPWSDTDYDGARLKKLAIDLKAQAEFVDVFSPMPYHARFGHADDPEWISRQTAWLGSYLGISGQPDEKIKIWPIVQISDWGEEVPASQVAQVLSEGVQSPSTGVIVFAWGSLRKQPDKVEEVWKFFK